ncbi:MAG: putative Zn-dependent protease [Rickettsiaceae bacterium]|nr:putative Zn-dependent protease [Rickettsiaceae bacterium]
MIKFLISILISFLLLVNTADASNSESFTLQNGMQVVVVTNTKVPAVSHMVWYKIGSQDELPGKTGIAHFLEHLMFKGTKNFGKGEFSSLVAKAGGNDNAFTAYDYTAYFQNIARDKLELVMQLESDRMQNLVFDQESVYKERDVILEERSSRIDNEPSSLLNEQMRAMLYLNHPYHHPIIGWRHEMEGLTAEDAKHWYESYYSPNNAVLVVSGDITAKELKPLAEKYYGAIKPKNTPVRHFLEEPRHLAPRNISMSDSKVAKPEWKRFYIAPSQNSSLKEYCFPLILLSYILGDSNTSKLYQKLVVEDEIAASIGSYYDDLALGPSIFTIAGTPSPKHNLDTIEKAVDNQINLIKQNGVSEEDLKRAKNSLIAAVIYQREDLKNLAYVYGQAMVTDAGTEYIDTWEEKIKAVTAEQIKAAAIAVLRKENSVTGRLQKE